MKQKTETAIVKENWVEKLKGMMMNVKMRNEQENLEYWQVLNFPVIFDRCIGEEKKPKKQHKNPQLSVSNFLKDISNVS